jgi:multicomponent Na+:H+ antiporter subunit C
VNTTLLFALVAALLFGQGLYGAIVARDVLHRLIALNVTGSAVFLLLVTLARRGPGEPDPVPHAMVLTGIVVAVAASGLAVALVRRTSQPSGRPPLPEDRTDE